MATLQSVFLATTLKSEHAIVAKVMNKRNLNKVVSFVIKDLSTQRRSTLYHELRNEDRLVDKQSVGKKRLPKAHRMMVICHYDASLPVYANIRFYREKLQRIFGSKCRYAVRAYERIMIKEA